MNAHVSFHSTTRHYQLLEAALTDVFYHAGNELAILLVGH